MKEGTTACHNGPRRLQESVQNQVQASDHACELARLADLSHGPQVSPPGADPSPPSNHFQANQPKNEHLRLAMMDGATARRGQQTVP